MNLPAFYNNRFRKPQIGCVNKYFFRKKKMAQQLKLKYSYIYILEFYLIWRKNQNSNYKCE